MSIFGAHSRACCSACHSVKWPPCPRLQSIIPVPYFASERSFAQFRLPEDVRSIVAFGTVPSTLVVVSASGAFYTASFDTDKGGACQQHSFARFIESDNEL